MMDMMYTYTTRWVAESPGDWTISGNTPLKGKYGILKQLLKQLEVTV